MELTKVKIGGVPEHFNLPWHLAIESHSFEKQGIDLKWVDYPGGTGAMCKDLRNGTLDMAVLLTEGIVADIIKGNPSKIVQWFVKSPLQWGIHVPADSTINEVKDMQGKKYAISRFGSGSHLMAFVDASQRGWSMDEQQFEVVGDLQGAREALKNNKADIFMWEKFMTKPLVDNGEFRRIDVCPTPWPCFAVVATQETLKTKSEAIKNILSIVTPVAKTLKNDPLSFTKFSERYGLKPEDVKVWLESTEWAYEPSIQKATLQKVVETLYSLKLVEKKIEIGELVSDFTKIVD